MVKWKGIVGRSFDPEAFELYASSLVFGSWKPEFVVVHNTFEPNLANWHEASGEARMQNLQTYYRDTMKWSAGPHLFVADDLIWAFTPLTVPGVHSPSWNGVSWGVEMVGNYDVEAFSCGPGAKVAANAVAALAILHARLAIDSSTIRFHKEDPLTTHKNCPGKNVVKADLVERVHEAILALRAG
jgi:hypothetical protein